MEIVGVEWRSTMSVLFHVPFLLGHLMNPLISYLTHTWDGFQMAVSIPSLFLLSYYWYVHKSNLIKRIKKLIRSFFDISYSYLCNWIILNELSNIIGLYQNHLGGCLLLANYQKQNEF